MRTYAPGAREVGTVDDTLYAVWFRAAQKSTVWYNTHVFDDAGVQPPATWDELLTTAQTISDFGVPPYSVGVDVGWPLSDLFENIYLRTAGPEMYDQLAKHEIPWTDQSVKDALTKMGDVLGNGDEIAGGTAGALQTDFNGSVVQMFNDPPEGAMLFEGNFVGRRHHRRDEGEGGSRRGLLRLPVDRRISTGGDGWRRPCRPARRHTGGGRS